MLRVSNKGRAIPESPIRKLVPYAEAAKKRGTEIFYLNIGQPDIKTPKVALDAVRNIDMEVLEYSTSNGSEQYRDKLVAYYKKHRINITNEQILVTTGGSEALYFTIASITDPQDEIIIPEPFYANYTSFSIAAGVKVVPINTSMEDGFALPKVNEFEALITPRTRAILICNPGNPTGTLYSKQEIRELKKLVVKYNLFLIADEVYREFVYTDEGHYSIMEEKGMDMNAIMIDSTSKRYSMCGARIGCVISKNPELISTVMKMAQSRLCPPTIAQIAAEAALDTPQSYFDEVKEEYIGRRNVIITELTKIEGVHVVKPNGAFYCLADLPVKNAEDFARWMLESYDNNGQTVMVAPASGFYSTPNIAQNQIRIAYVLEKEKLIRAVEILKDGLIKYSNSIALNQ
ncbi:aspartate aminotransferase [Wenyingzhuangia heitensis]|uniref:Aminotransferase n=1 Tax=Wenyingzhuangia heitensis TaxID=1487859 RepID=A0ABX0UDD0_9FLAO|nr:pyridoxal phosphate-dependent aminotransferase [Wenyingzhuangia heitensis]NIJ46344.1 aspartate aminotransferase [Wenyingzhuangia heitensis]